MIVFRAVLAVWLCPPAPSDAKPGREPADRTSSMGVTGEDYETDPSLQLAVGGATESNREKLSFYHFFAR